MDPFFGKIAVFVNLLTYVLIRWPHGRRIKELEVVEDRKGGLEVALLTGAALGTTLVPILWIVSPIFSFADFPLNPIALAAGVVFMVIGNWIFYRSHADLGVYWSPTLQVREEHKLVSSGIYSRIRHPMYTAMIVQGIAQALMAPNWIVAPAWLVTFGALYVFRVGREERMMLDRFGAEYEAYASATGRLLPRFARTRTAE